MEKTLGEVAIFTKGKGISKSDIAENGKLPCIRYGELYTHYNETISDIKSHTNLDPNDLILSEVNDVIIPASGETQIDIATASCVLGDGIALGGDLNIIKTNINGVFLAYYLNSAKKRDIAQIAQGISVVHLYSNQLKSLIVNIPNPQEQQKIADCLTSLDALITTQTEKLQALQQHKKGLMQNLFPAEGKTTPKLRFPEFQNAEGWKEERLGDLGSTFNGLSGKTKVDFGKGKQYIQYMQIFSSSKIDIKKFGLVNIKNNEKQNQVQYGDIFFTTSSETQNETGISSVLIEQVDNVYLNSFCFGYRPNSLNELVPKFSQFFFRSDKVRMEIIKLAQGVTRFNMSKIKFMDLVFNIPEKQEQQKIADCLSSLDALITTQTQKLQALQQHKKGLMQQLFIGNKL